MHDALLMRGADTSRDLRRVFDRFPRLERTR